MYPFPNVPWANIAATFDAFIAANGIDTSVTLRDGTQFTLRAARRYKNEVGVTDGLSQQGFELNISASDWDGLSPGREPMRGDQLELLDGRFSVDSYRLIAANDTRIGYVVRVTG